MKKEKKPSVFKRLSKFMGDKKSLFPIAFVLSIISAVFTLLPYYYVWKISRELFSNGSMFNMELVISYATKSVIYAVLGLLFYFFALMTSHFAAFEVEINMKKYGFKKVLRMPLGYFDEHLSGKLRKIILSGAESTHTFLAHQLPDMAGSFVTPIILLIMMFFFDWRMGIASLVPIAIGFSIMTTMMTGEAKQFQQEYNDSLEEMSSEAVEYVRGIPVVKTFGQSVHSFTRFYNSIIKYKELVTKFTLLWTKPYSIYGVLMSSAPFFIVPFAILLIGRGDNMGQVLGDFVFYLLVAPSFGLFMMRTMTISQRIFDANLALDRFEKILEYDNLVYGEVNNMDSFDIEFKNVDFAYASSDKKVLDGISFKIENGKTLALVGASGGGKTTIARLVARFWDIDSGEVLIGNKNIKEYSKDSLMENVSFVFQNNKLFKTTIRENILFGNPNATEEQIEKALENSRSKEIIDNLEDGLDTVIGTKGTYLSGGEMQRIALARAFLKDSSIVVLDEATAFADPENEHLIQKALLDLSNGKTTLMIAHRLTTVKDADYIAVVDKGKIVEYGSHDELIALKGVYNKMWNEYQQTVDWKISSKSERMG